MSSVKLDHRETKTVSDTPRHDRSLAQESKRRKVETEGVSEGESSLMSRELSEVELQSSKEKIFSGVKTGRKNQVHA